MEGREEWLREYWPVVVGVAIIVVGNVYLYGVRGQEWIPAGPSLAVAVVVVLAIELGRSAYGRWG